MLLEIIDKHAPIIRLKLRHHAPGWFNHELLSHIDEREFWSRKYKKFPCLDHLTRKLDAIARTKALKRKLQQNYFKDALEKCGNDSKAKWKLIREFWPHLKRSSNIAKINSSTEDHDKANDINQFFANIGEELATSIPDSDDNPCEEVMAPTFEFLETDNR